MLSGYETVPTDVGNPVIIYIHNLRRTGLLETPDQHRTELMKEKHIYICTSIIRIPRFNLFICKIQRNKDVHVIRKQL